MTPARYDALAAILAAAPPGWRFFLKHRILDALLHAEAPPQAGALAVAAAYAGVAAAFPDLPG